MRMRVGPPAVWVSTVVRTLVSFMGVSGGSVEGPGTQRGATRGKIAGSGVAAHAGGNLPRPTAYQGPDDATREGTPVMPIRTSRTLLYLGVMALGAASPGAVARATPASAQQSGTIHGTVTCALTRQPLEGVTIKVGVHDSVAALTGPDGRFFLGRVPPGRTTLVVELRPGYVPALRLVDVLPGSVTEIPVELAPVTTQADELVVAVEGSDPSATVRMYPMGGARALGGGGSASGLQARG
ncbi:MAG: carboxypeptidase-like regulatory domain-containing protein, partial [Gemmatimonadetes bacterium]|nr:carboxypeptidase-like regulatory domain-containing protein [Gemmatimonadota bacterium]